MYPLALQADGKILVGGNFTALAGQAREHLGRLNADGTLDTTFTNGANNIVLSLAVQTNGQILVGGWFTTLAGQTRNYVGRLNADGSLDTTFTNGANNYVYSLAVQADGKILVGGYFTSLAGQACSRLGRLNADGTLDTTFTNGANNPVYSMTEQADGKLVVGGGFTSLAGQPRNYLGRLNADGSLDTTFTNGAGAHTAQALALQADGKLVVGGQFTTLAGQPRSYLGRLSTDSAAIQNLRATTNSVTWGRSGAGPEVWRTTFEQSSNGVDWISLGAGARVTGGWQVTNLALPTDTNFYVRARGFARGGVVNGSESIIESVRLVYFAPSIQVLGTNGAVVFSGEAASAAKGTDFGSLTIGLAMTNRLAIANAGTATLTIGGITTHGAGGAAFQVSGFPTQVSAGTVSNFTLIFQPTVSGIHTAAVEIANNSIVTPYRLYLTGIGLKRDQTIDFPNPGTADHHQQGWPERDSEFRPAGCLRGGFGTGGAQRRDPFDLYGHGDCSGGGLAIRRCRLERGSQCDEHLQRDQGICLGNADTSHANL